MADIQKNKRCYRNVSNRWNINRVGKACKLILYMARENIGKKDSSQHH